MVNQCEQTAPASGAGTVSADGRVVGEIVEFGLGCKFRFLNAGYENGF